MSIDAPLPGAHDEPGARDVEMLLRDSFGIDGRLTRLDGEYDLNWRVDSTTGTYIAKVSIGAGASEPYEFQEALLNHVHRVDPELRIPVPVAAAGGETSVQGSSIPEGWRLRVFDFVPGRPLRDTGRSPELLESLGHFMGRLSLATQGFGHPGAHQDHLWNLDHAGRHAGLSRFIEPADVRERVERVFERWDRLVRPLLPSLPAAVVHHDANDDNVLVDVAGGKPCIGLIDFGDAVFARRINELAVTLAYALMDVPDIPEAARAVIRGYTAVLPLTEDELAVLFDLVAARLAMSLCISSQRRAETPDNPYLQVSQDQARKLLHRLETLDPAFTACLTRAAAGRPPVATGDAIVAWLSRHAHGFESVFPFDLRSAPRIVISLERGAPGLERAEDPIAYGRWLSHRMHDVGAEYAVGRYAEQRACYTTAQFRSKASDQPRSVHLGMDLFAASGTPVRAPLAGRVWSLQDNDLPLDYGATVILEHRCGADGPVFWTLYGHLSRKSLSMTTVGTHVEAGDTIAEIGTHEENGGWTPHLHFQIITDMLGQHGNFHGAGEPGNMDVWRAVCPDPNLILDLAPETFETHPSSPSGLEARRHGLLGRSLSLSYHRHLEIVRGRGAWLYDHTGRAYLDCVNNICHVGHCHPRVVQALHDQAARLNTNTRYLHPNIVRYAERLLATFPDPLSVCFFVCSGSEANELALRLARTATAREDLLVLDWAYHGNTTGLIDASPYKFKRRGGCDRPEHVHVAELPDPYRGPHKGYAERTAVEYARSVEDCIAACRERTGAGPAAMIAESIPGCAGQIVFPDRYLAHAFQRVREAGGLCIADEVQTGFGRVGDHMWAFELQEAMPDIVTLGKPIGNGHPMAAVITTREIADAFANGMEYFNSFGGNPVSCAVGLAVLDVIQEEALQDKARATGAYLLQRLQELAHRHPVIGDVRGRGMFIGIELVEDRETLEPATRGADRVVNLLREDAVLLSTDGPCENVLKFKPPLSFGRSEADILCEKLDKALAGIDAAGD